MQEFAIDGHADTARGAVWLQASLPTRAEQVWQALTVSSHTSRWLGRLSVSAITDGSDFSVWHDEDVRSRHTVVQWQPGRLLTLTWDFPEERPSRVSFTLTKTTPSTTTLAVEHDNLDNAVPYVAGWHRHLQYLEAHLKGEDLPLEDFWTGYDRLVEHYERNRPKSDV